jgi:hypothetical protein
VGASGFNEVKRGRQINRKAIMGCCDRNGEPRMLWKTRRGGMVQIQLARGLHGGIAAFGPRRMLRR